MTENLQFQNYPEINVQAAAEKFSVIKKITIIVELSEIEIQILRVQFRNIFMGLARQNLSHGETFGVALQKAMEQANSMLAGKQQNNAAVAQLQKIAKENQAAVSRALMTHQNFAAKTAPAEKTQAYQVKGLNQVKTALPELNKKIAAAPTMAHPSEKIVPIAPTKTVQPQPQKLMGSAQAQQQRKINVPAMKLYLAQRRQSYHAAA